MSGDQSNDGFSKERADLFEALGHPLRLEILRALSESPLGFADLKRRVNVTSSGHLTHHLEKLDGLVMTTPEGLYGLTDDGREALRIVSAPKGSSSDKSHDDKKVLLSRTILAGLIAAILLLASVAVIQELEVMNLAGKVTSQNQPFSITSDFNSSVLQVIGTSLTPVISQGQNVSVSAEVYNPLEQGIQTTADPRGTSLSPCGGPSPVDAEIYLGYYTPNNISGGTPLVLNPEAYCLFSMAFTTVYTFYPHSDMALISSSGNDTKNTSEVRGLFSTSGYYTYVLDPTISAYTAKFQTFAPGTYTVLVSDVWGHTGICYFQVVSSQTASPVSISVEGSSVNSTTFTYENSTASFSSMEVFPLFITAESVTDVHLSLAGVRDGMWAKLMPENLTSVGPDGASSALVIAGAVTPGSGSGGFTISVTATDDEGHSSTVSERLVLVVNVAVLRSASEIYLRTTVGTAIAVFPVTDQVVPYGAVYEPLTPDYALRPLQPENLSVSLQPLGVLVNGSVQALPPWLQVVIPEASFNLTADVPHYFELGVKLVLAPLGNFTIVVGETIGGENFVAYVNYTVFPQPHT